MKRKKALYISGSLGLGHVVRDLAIARELYKQCPNIELSWLAAPPASMEITKAGEKLLSEAEMYADDNIPAENAAEEGFKLNLLKYLTKAMGDWEHNVQAFKNVINRGHFDIVIADEAYEIEVAIEKKRVQLEVPFVMMYDFIGNNSMRWNPLEILGTYMWNREWVQMRSFYDRKNKIAIFIGELEDIPNTSLGFFLPNRRELAKETCEFVGYVFPFNSENYKEKAEIRAKLEYGKEPLVICSIGGTSVGKDLLTLCGQAYSIIKERIPNLHMVLVCGPRLAADSLNVPSGIDVKGYVPALYEHFAACDLAIVHGGGTTTLELTALRRPFIYFPIEGHFEQQVHVTNRLMRHQAGVKMTYSKTTPESLADEIIANIGKEVTYKSISTNGAKNVAQIIRQLI